jgi:arylsulfatase A-like enzyme
MEGRSLVPLMRGGTIDPRPAFAMNLEQSSSRDRQIRNGTIVVWDGDYKMIHKLEKENSLLFNLRDDPGELNNLIDAESEVRAHLLDLIHENLKKANERIAMK